MASLAKTSNPTLGLELTFRAIMRTTKPQKSEQNLGYAHIFLFGCNKDIQIPRIMETENSDVSLVREVVCKNAFVSASMHWSNNTHIGWLVPRQSFNERFRPAW